MSILISERVAFLNQMHIFVGLDADKVLALAERLVEESYSAGKEISTGEKGDKLFLIWSGKVSVTQKDKLEQKTVLVPNDFFGEEALLGRRSKNIQYTAMEDTIVLILSRKDYTDLHDQMGGFRTNIAVAANSRRLARHLKFKWLQPEEVIYYLALKHPILLVKALLFPSVLAVVAIVGMLAAWYYSLWYPLLSTFWYACLFLGIGATAWGAWRGIDWGNDHYVVTDRRVVWVEKVLGVYESRQETPLSAIQRVSVDTELTGRVLDYGDIVIRTIVGSTLTLRNLDHPHQAAALIDQHWRRTKDDSRRLEEKEMKETLHARLVEGKSSPVDLQGVVTKPSAKVDPYEHNRGIINFLRVRFEHLATVTYRKHILVLFEQTWIPGLILFILSVTIVYDLFSPGSPVSRMLKIDPALLVFVWMILLFIAIGWWIYQYVDWRNDIFQVTSDQIMDIDKTPLGQVTSDIASLDSILSIEYERVGLLEVLFNYGTVYITVGGGKKMAFEQVYNPSAVQDDIERRRLEKITQKEQESIKAERERVADWFAAYHKSELQLHKEGQSGGEQQIQDQSKNEVK